MARTFMPFRNGTIAPLEDLYREVDSLVQNIFDPEDSRSKFTPFANLAETEAAYELTLDLPGIDPEEVAVEINEGKLVVAGERRSETESSDKTFHRVERRYGHFRRVLSIPAPVDEDGIVAEYRDGVLTVTLPKCDKVRSKRIQVNKAD